MMSKLTEEQREDLDSKIDPLTNAIEMLRAEIKPIAMVIDTLRDQRNAVLEQYGIEDDFDDLGQCEECSCFIAPGEKRFSYEDGPTFCAEHAPTFNELRASAAGDLTIAQEAGNAEEIADLTQYLARMDEKIAAGRGDEKNVW